MEFWKCFFYFALTGVLAFFVGRLIPKDWLHADGFLFRCRSFEQEGKLYEKLNIKQWQNRLPDMSRILPFLMPPKKLSGDYKQRLPLMIEETCVAELIHILVCITGLYSLQLWPGMGGITVYLLYVVFFNLPYILIQRYNRPRLMKLYRKTQHGSSSDLNSFSNPDIQPHYH